MKNIIKTGNQRGKSENAGFNWKEYQQRKLQKLEGESTEKEKVEKVVREIVKKRESFMKIVDTHNFKTFYLKKDVEKQIKLVKKILKKIKLKNKTNSYFEKQISIYSDKITNQIINKNIQITEKNVEKLISEIFYMDIFEEKLIKNKIKVIHKVKGWSLSEFTFDEIYIRVLKKIMKKKDLFFTKGYKSWLSRVIFTTSVDIYRKNQSKKEIEIVPIDNDLDSLGIFKDESTSQLLMEVQEMVNSFKEEIKNLDEEIIKKLSKKRTQREIDKILKTKKKLLIVYKAYTFGSLSQVEFEKTYFSRYELLIYNNLISEILSQKLKAYELTEDELSRKYSSLNFELKFLYCFFELKSYKESKLQLSLL